MKELLFKLFGYHQLMIFMVNPDYVRLDSFKDAIKNFPIVIILSQNEEKLRVLSSGVFVRKKNDRTLSSNTKP